MVLQNYGSVASAYGPLTRLMPKAKKSGSLGQQNDDKQRHQKQKDIQRSLLEYTKRMDKIKQARLAISRSRDQGRLSAAAKQTKTRVVLPGLSEENSAIALSNKFVSQAQWQSANSVAQDVTRKNAEALPSERTIKSNIFSSEIQKLSESSPNSFNQYWRVLNEGGQVKHIPVLKTPDGIVYSTVSRPATINKPPEVDKAGKRYGESDTKLVEVDEQGTTITKETFRRYHPGILPKPGMKGPYKSRVTLHVLLPQVESDTENGCDDESDDGTESCSIHLSNDSRSSSPVDIPKKEENLDRSNASNEESPEKTGGTGGSPPTKDEDEEPPQNNVKGDKKRENVESDACKDGGINSKSEVENKVEQGTSINHEKAKKESESEDTTQNEEISTVRNKSGQVNNASEGKVSKTVPQKGKAAKTEQTNKHENHYPCDDCPVCKMEAMGNISPKPQKSILKKDDIKPLPNIPSTEPFVGDTAKKSKKRRASLQQVRLPGGIVKLGKINYHRSYKINVHPVPPHIKGMINGVEPGVTLHDTYEDAVNRTDVLREAERTIQFEKLRKENQARMKKLGSIDGKKDKLWQALCRHGRFVKECYTCRAVEEIRQRLKQTYTKGEQQYQWNLLKKHERQLAQGIDPNANPTKQRSARNSATRFRLGSIANATDLADIASEDTQKPDGRPGGRVVTDKEGGRANPQGLLPSNGSIPSSLTGGKTVDGEESNELSQSKRRVRFSEERIYNPMRGSYRKKTADTEQVLLPPIENG